MVKLSIIVPIYGVEQYLRKCVDSLLSQDIPSSEYEIILVDDGGKDACPQICDEYARMNELENEGVRKLGKPLIRVIHRENGGLSAARNSGIEAAQSEYIMFVDSDDYIEPNVLGALLSQMERDNLDVLRYNYQNVNEHYEIFNPNKDPNREVD
jgi:glycosyltransferase involved in cell wall biosynthesis